MKSVFISGSISIKSLPMQVINSFDKIISQNIQVYVGDADGIDRLTQDYFASKEYTNVIVCTIKEYPRNLSSKLFCIKNINYDKNIKNEREKQTSKDEFMTQSSDYSFVIWDGKSKGSFANIKRAIEHNKKIKVYYVDFGRCLEKEELNISYIENIYKSNTGYTLSEIMTKIKSSNIYTNISKASELKELFINNKILKQSSDKLEINNNYKNYFIVENYRGTQNIKYKKDVLDLIAGNSIFGGRNR